MHFHSGAMPSPTSHSNKTWENRTAFGAPVMPEECVAVEDASPDQKQLPNVHPPNLTQTPKIATCSEKLPFSTHVPSSISGMYMAQIQLKERMVKNPVIWTTRWYHRHSESVGRYHSIHSKGYQLVVEPPQKLKQSQSWQGFHKEWWITIQNSTLGLVCHLCLMRFCSTKDPVVSWNHPQNVLPFSWFQLCLLSIAPLPFHQLDIPTNGPKTSTNHQFFGVHVSFQGCITP